MNIRDDEGVRRVVSGGVMCVRGVDRERDMTMISVLVGNVLGVRICPNMSIEHVLFLC